MKIDVNSFRESLDQALIEDSGIAGDITSSTVIRENKLVDFQIIAKENLVLCGTSIAEYYFRNFKNNYELLFNDGDYVKKNQAIFRGRAYAHDILLLERVTLNFLQHLSGVASLTKRYVDKVSNTKAKICDTRKTLPGIKILQKYAVRCGGGYNHRFCLSDGLLIKDNHIAICGGIKEAIHNAKLYSPHYTAIEIECKTLDQVSEASQHQVKTIMLDNMSLAEITEAISIIKGRTLIEVSGGVNIENVAAIANTGVNYISIGKLTHSADAVDIGLDIITHY